MRNKLIPIGLLAALLACGCANIPTNQTALEKTLARIDATVPLATAIAVRQDPSCESELLSAAVVIEGVVSGGVIDPNMLLDNLNTIGLSQNAQLAVMGGIAIWQLYLVDYPNTLEIESRLILATIARDIRLGLPPSTPDSLRALKRGARR